MDKRKILTLASAAAILLAPAAFYAATQYERSAASTGFGEPDYMATEFAWTPKHSEPDYMATEFVWTPKHAEPDYMATEFVWMPKHAEPDYMATEFVWIPKQARPTGLRVAEAEQAR